MRNYILFLLLSILVIPKLYLLAQINDVTRLPTQSSAEVLFESAPVIISENEIIIFYVSENIDTIYSTFSDDRGANWGIHKIVQTVQLEDPNQELIYLSALKTNTGRLILAWSLLNDGMYLVHSDDNGSSWSVPQRILGGGTNNYTRQNSEYLNLSQVNDGRLFLCFNKGGFLNQLYYK